MEGYPGFDKDMERFFDYCRKNGLDPADEFVRQASELAIPAAVLGLKGVDDDS